jgi:hypothetical protein
LDPEQQRAGSLHREGEGLTLNNLGHAYRELRQPDRAAMYWRDAAAAAMRDAGDHEEAARLEQLAANARSRRAAGGETSDRLPEV